MPSKDTTVVKIISKVQARNASAMGNPQFTVTCTDGTVYRTQTDAAVNYSIQNSEFMEVPVELTLTPAGRIRYVYVATP